MKIITTIPHTKNVNIVRKFWVNLLLLLFTPLKKVSVDPISHVLS